MARGSLFSHFRKRVEEIRINSLTPAELKEEAIRDAATRVDAATTALEALKAEFQEVNEKHHLTLVGMGTLQVGFGTFQDVQRVKEWFKGFAVKLNEASVEFSNACSQFAALKPADYSVSHLDGSEKERNYRIMKTRTN
jgi:hypothetical protein